MVESLPGTNLIKNTTRPRRKKRTSQSLPAVDKSSERTSSKRWAVTETETLKIFLNIHFHSCGVPKTIETDVDPLSRNQKFFLLNLNWYEFSIGTIVYALATNLVEYSIQTHEGLLLSILEDGQKLEQRVNCASSV